jgi:hypothetical protein
LFLLKSVNQFGYVAGISYLCIVIIKIENKIMKRIKAKCIKETYTWDGDGKQHKFPYVKVGLVYVFDVEFTPKPTYWLNKSL